MFPLTLHFLRQSVTHRPARLAHCVTAKCHTANAFELKRATWHQMCYLDHGRKSFPPLDKNIITPERRQTWRKRSDKRLTNRIITKNDNLNLKGICYAPQNYTLHLCSSRIYHRGSPTKHSHLRVLFRSVCKDLYLLKSKSLPESCSSLKILSLPACSWKYGPGSDGMRSLDGSGTPK